MCADCWPHSLRTVLADNVRAHLELATRAIEAALDQATDHALAAAFAPARPPRRRSAKPARARPPAAVPPELELLEEPLVDDPAPIAAPTSPPPEPVIVNASVDDGLVVAAAPESSPPEDPDPGEYLADPDEPEPDDAFGFGEAFAPWAADASPATAVADPGASNEVEKSATPRRRRRRTRPRAKTIAMKRLTREELRLGALMFPPVEDVARPRHRSECREEARPCPWVSCKHHLYLDVNPESGSIKINFPDVEPWDLPETCALDIAERGGITLEEVGEIMNLTRERIRQVEIRGLLKIRMGSPSPEEVGAALLHPPGS